MLTSKVRFSRASLEGGVSLIEVLVAVGIFVIAITSIGLLGFSSIDLAREASERTQAVLFAEEGLEAARAIRSEGFQNLTEGTHGLALSGGKWVLTAGPEVIGPYTRSINIESLGSGRTKIDSAVSWQLARGQTATVALTTYLHNLFSRFWLQSTAAEFEGGKHNSTRVASAGDGEVILSLVGDWTRPKVLATHDLSLVSTVYAMAEAGGTLFTVSSNGTFAAVDISDAESGVFPLLDQLSVGTSINGVAVSGKYAYLATSDNARELIVVRLSDFSIVNTLNLTGNADALALASSGTTLYLSRANSSAPELLAIDIALPETALPILRSLNVSGNLTALALSGLYLYAGGTSNASELLVIRQSDLLQVNSLNLPGNADVTGTQISGTTLYLSRIVSGGQEFVSVDIGDPLAVLSVQNGFNHSASVRGFAISGDRAYLATDSASLEFVVLSLPAMTQLGAMNITTTSGSRAVLFRGAYAYAGSVNANPEITVIRGGEGEWESPVLQGGINTAGNADGLSMAVSGSYAYLGTASNGSGPEFYVIDITDKFAPLIRGSREIGASVNAISLSGNYAYLATSNGRRELVVMNIADETDPVIAGVYDANRSLAGLSVYATGTRTYLGTQNNTSGSGREFYVLDTSVPSSPVLLGSSEIGASVRGMTGAGSFIALATEHNSKELVVLDVSNPALVSQIAVYNTAGSANGLNIFFDNAIVYLVTENNGSSPDLYLFDFFPNGTVTLRSSLDLSANNYAVGVRNGHAFVANNKASGGLAVLNVENPSAPRLLSDWNSGGQGRAVAYDGASLSLAATNNARELAIVGPSGLPSEFAREGWFTSSAFDSGAEGTAWGVLSWSMSGTGTIETQTRTADTLSGLREAQWAGTGAVGGYYTASSSPVFLDPNASGVRWIEYRAWLSGDGVNSPSLHDVQITY